jgi:hypothetical protein
MNSNISKATNQDSPCRWAANVVKDGWDCIVHGGFGYDPIDLALSCPERVSALKREIERLRAMEQRLKSSFTRGTMDSPWLQRNSLHLGVKAVAFMRWVWSGEEK